MNLLSNFLLYMVNVLLFCFLYLITILYHRRLIFNIFTGQIKILIYIYIFYSFYILFNYIRTFYIIIFIL